jgi:hypothetical protein
MAQLSSQHLAELLIGIARAQTAVLQGLESAMAGIKTTHVLPMLQNAAHLRDHPEPTLMDLPVRILLATQGRVPPDPAAIARDLDRLSSGTASAPAPSSAAAASPAPAAAAPAGGDTLDFSKPAA